MNSPVDNTNTKARELTAAELGAFAHLYRGEIYRSTVWRTRLDNTTNWSVVTLGLALSITFSNKDATPLPLILVGILIIGFLGLEARRYRYFNVWRARSRWMETHFYAPMLRGDDVTTLSDWHQVLANDYSKPRYHISYPRAIGRRLRRNYIWIFAIQGFAYYGKMAVQPSAIVSWNELWDRAKVGPLSGQLMVTLGALFYIAIIVITIATYVLDREKHKNRRDVNAMG